jgi:hypothetical protein
LHGRPAPLTRPFYAWPHPAFLCIPKHRRGAGVYTLSWAGGIAQKLIAMCEHWLPLEIANVSLFFLLQMLHVKNINWTLRFGAVASEPAAIVEPKRDHWQEQQPNTFTSMAALRFLYLHPRFLSVCFNQRRPRVCSL